MFLIIFTDRAAKFERGYLGERGFIVSNGTMFAMHDVRTISGSAQYYFKYYRLFTTFAESSAFDAISNIIYVLDSKDNSLKKENMLTLEESTLVSTVDGKGNKEPHMYLRQIQFTKILRIIEFTLDVLIHSP